jgi:phosphohistidine phosphatase
VKRLYLLRHTKSDWDDPTLDDHERPLAARGRRAADRIAEHLRRGDVRPDLVLCSSSRRTLETLARIAPSLGERADFRIERDLYAADGASLLARLRRLPGSVSSAMLIAHNPGIQDLALDLAGSGDPLPRLRDRFPTGALATLEFSGAWSGLGEHTADLVSFVTPKDLP